MDANDLIFTRISQASIIIPTVIALIRWRLLNDQLRLLAWVLIVSSLTEICAFTLVEGFKVSNNLFLYHFYIIVLFVLVNRIYKRTLKELYSGVTANWILFIFLVFALINTVGFQPFQVFNSNVIVVAGMLFIFYSLSYFYHRLTVGFMEKWYQEPLFWLSSGLLIHYSSTLMLFFAVNFMLDKSSALIGVSWMLNAGLNVLLNLFYVLAILNSKNYE